MAEKLATIISMIIAVVIYGLAVVVLRIFTKEEIYSLPCGNKIYNILEKTGIYKCNRQRNKIHRKRRTRYSFAV